MHSPRLGEHALRASHDPIAEQLRFEVLEFLDNKADDQVPDRPDLAKWLAGESARIRASEFPPRTQ